MLEVTGGEEKSLTSELTAPSPPIHRVDMRHVGSMNDFTVWQRITQNLRTSVGDTSSANIEGNRIWELNQPLNALIREGCITKYEYVCALSGISREQSANMASSNPRLQ